MKKNDYNILFDKIRNNDVNAFNALYKDYFAPLCVFAYRYISDRKTVEDCVQDVFLKIWRDRQNINIKSSIQSYLLSATKNNCLNIIEKRKTEQTYEQYILNTYDNYSSEDLYSIGEIRELITKAIERLPEKHRIVFSMSRFEGMTYKEIAEKQNISLKTVEAYIHKSLIHLSLHLKDYLPSCILYYISKISDFS